MLRKSIVIAFILIISACNSSENQGSSSASTKKSSSHSEGSLVFDFSKTEIKPEACLPKLKVKETKTSNIKSLKAQVALFNATGEKFNAIDLDIRVGSPLATVLFFPQSVKCDDLKINISIEQCTTQSNDSGSSQCPEMHVVGAEAINDVSLSQ